MFLFVFGSLISVFRKFSIQSKMFPDFRKIKNVCHHLRSSTLSPNLFYAYVFRIGIYHRERKSKRHTHVVLDKRRPRTFPQRQRETLLKISFASTPSTFAYIRISLCFILFSLKVQRNLNPYDARNDVV